MTTIEETEPFVIEDLLKNIVSDYENSYLQSKCDKKEIPFHGLVKKIKNNSTIFYDISTQFVMYDENMFEKL